jgi:hypothetical protein
MLILFFIVVKSLKRVFFQRADVRSQLEIQSGIKKALETWPERTIGGLVHCAGVGGADKVGHNAYVLFVPSPFSILHIISSRVKLLNAADHSMKPDTIIFAQDCQFKRTSG